MHARHLFTDMIDARQIQSAVGTQAAARHLKALGYSVEAAAWILAGRV